MADDERLPHAEREFGRFVWAMQQSLPRKLTRGRRVAASMKALTATTTKKVKR